MFFAVFALVCLSYFFLSPEQVEGDFYALKEPVCLSDELDSFTTVGSILDASVMDKKYLQSEFKELHCNFNGGTKLADSRQSSAQFSRQ